LLICVGVLGLVCLLSIALGTRTIALGTRTISPGTRTISPGTRTISPGTQLPAGVVGGIYFVWLVVTQGRRQ